MSKHELISNFDPYDALVQMDLRLQQITLSHNQMAQEFHKLQQEFNLLVESHQGLQKSQFHMAELLASKLFTDLKNK